MAATDRLHWYRTGLLEEKSGFFFEPVEHLYQVKSPYQEIEVIQTTDFGRVLLLDREIMTTEWDGFVYPEMLAHPALMSHNGSQRLAIIGGGDGGVATEARRYSELESVVVCEIDREVVKAAREFFPRLSAGFADPRTTCVYEEGSTWLALQKNPLDILFVDGTDPIGPGKKLFEEDFYRQAFRIVGSDGIFVQQIESPFYSVGADSLCFELRFEEIVARARKVFDQVYVYWTVIPTYLGSFWAFLYAGGPSLSKEPILSRWEQVAGQTRFYSPEIHRAAFVLPPFVKSLLNRGPQ